MSRCCVSTCTNVQRSSNKGSGISFHFFPKDPVLQNKWRISCGYFKEFGRRTSKVIGAVDDIIDAGPSTSQTIRKPLPKPIPQLHPQPGRKRNHIGGKLVMQRTSEAAPDFLSPTRLQLRRIQTEITKSKLKQRISATYGSMELPNRSGGEHPQTVKALAEEVARLQEESAALKARTQPPGIFRIERFKTCPEAIALYTGFASFAALMEQLRFVMPTSVRPDRINKFALFLVKLRQGLPFRVVADVFGVSRPTAERIFYNWVSTVHACVGPLQRFPSRKRLAPEDGRRIGSIACVEMAARRSSGLVKTRSGSSYSRYGCCSALRAVVVAGATGRVLYASPLYGAAVSDEGLCMGLVENLKFAMTNRIVRGDDVLLADGDISVRELLDGAGLERCIPSCKLSSACQSSGGSEKEGVRRVMERLRGYRILDNVLAINSQRTMDRVFSICCYFAEFHQPPVEICGEPSAQGAVASADDDVDGDEKVRFLYEFMDCDVEDEDINELCNRNEEQCYS